MSRTIRARSAAGAGLAGVILAVGGLTSSVSAQDPVTFRVGLTEAPSQTALNPYLALLAEDYLLFSDQYDLLVGFGADLEPVPGLAESWGVSDDGLTWTWHMRPGVTWADGAPFTAEDVRFQFQYIRDSHDPAYIGPQAPDGNDLLDGDGNASPDGSADYPLSLFDSYLDLDGGLEASRITSIEAPDELTLVITTSAPVATLAQIFIPILPKHIWEGITFEEASVSPLSVEQSVGTGPFRMVEFEPQQAVVLEGRDDYWAGAPYIDRLVYQFFDNDEAQVQALITGDVDYLNLFPPTLAPTLLAAPGVTVNTASSTDFGELGFNSWAPTPERFLDEGCTDCPKGPTTGSMGDPWLTRADVRAAIAGLLDKQQLIDFAQSGYAEPGLSVVSPRNPAYSYTPPADDPVTFPAYADEAGRAAARETAETRFREAMAAIGFGDTDGSGILNVPSDDAAVAFDPEGAGADWHLRLHIRDSDTEDKLAASLIGDWLTSAGVAVEVLPVSTDELTRLVYPYQSNADTDLFMWGWGPDPDPDFILGVFTCDQINNWGDANYCDADYDELYRSQRSQVDPVERAATIQALQDKLYHDSPYAVLWYVNNLEAYRSDRWEGMQAVPTEGGTWWSAAATGPVGSRITVRPLGTPVRPAAAP
jgi:peptide/nickel transport system substrate-binding protein